MGVLLDDLRGVVKPKRMVPSYGYTQPISGYERDTAIVAKFFFVFFIVFFFVVVVFLSS